MKKIENNQRKEAYLDRYFIRSLFRFPDRIGFELYEFSKGEIINNLMDPIDYLLFTVDGKIRICNVRNDGTPVLLVEEEDFTVLGDIEFARNEVSAYIVEAASKVTCLSVDVNRHHSVLENDPVFLSFLLRSVAEKLALTTVYILEPEDLRERTIYYLQHQTLSGVASAASYLHCSKRQLLRILKCLQEEGTVIKTGRGTYRLKQ